MVELPLNRKPKIPIITVSPVNDELLAAVGRLTGEHGKIGWMGDKKQDNWIIVEGMHEAILTPIPTTWYRRMSRARNTRTLGAISACSHVW